MPYDSFDRLLDTPELAITLIDGTLYASTVHAEATDAEILLAATTAAANGAASPQLSPAAREKLVPLDWTPPAN